MFPQPIGAGKTLNAFQTLLAHAEQQVKDELVQLLVGQRLRSKSGRVKGHGAQGVGILRRERGRQQRV